MKDTRRKNGEGYLRETAAGTIEYRFRYTDENGRRKYKSVSGVSEAHCYERAEQFLYELERRINTVDLSATIVTIIREEIKNEFQKKLISDQGFARKMQTLAMIERHSVGNMPINKVRGYHIENFFDYIKSYSNSTIYEVTAMMKDAFLIAMRKKIIETNVIEEENMRCPKSDKPDKKIKGMTVEEQKRFVATLNEHKVRYGSNSYRLQLLIELYSGMRMGEINALKPEDINFKKGFIHVSRSVTVTRNNKRILTDYTEVYDGERDIPISKQLEKILRQALEEMKDNPDGLVFYDYKNKSIISTTQVNSVFKTLCKKAGVICNGQHTLRHTFATRCIEAEVPALVLKSWLGHKNVNVTLEMYKDVFNRMNLGEIYKFENRIAEFQKYDEGE